MNQKKMTIEEAVVLLSDELDDEVVRSDSYREAAIGFLDHAANMAVDAARTAREEKRTIAGQLVVVPESTTTH